MSFLKNVNNGQKFFVMNLIVTINKRKLMRTKIDKTKEIKISRL
jgi:hypothetical protein